MFNFSKSNLVITFFATLLTLLIFYLSMDELLWLKFWSALSIPPQPAFSDLKAHVYYYNCFIEGIDIFSEKCTLIPAGGSVISTHPSIWIDIVRFLKLYNTTNLNIFLIASYTIYFYLFFNLFKIFDSKEKKFFLLIFFFSTTNFILIERYSTDLLIFILVYSLILLKSDVTKFSAIAIASLLKFYPVFLLLIFIKNKKFLFSSSLILILFIYIFYLDEILLTNKNLVEMALFTAYGSRTMLKAFYHLSENYNFFLNNDNLDFYRNITIIFFVVYSFAVTFLGYFSKKQKLHSEFSISEKYFLIGSSIYIGTFIFAANADYRLIFLIFTIPYILEINNIFIRYLLSLCIVISINSFLFQFGEVLSISFFMRAILIFGCKFIIFSSFLIFIGNLLKKIKFFKLA